MQGEVKIPIRVRYCETDQMGVAHHSSYWAWFEVARTELFRQKGLAYAELEKAGICLPVVEGYCRYLHLARYDDLLTVSARVAEASPARLSFAYAVRRGETTLAEGSTAHAFINRAGRPLNLKKAAPELWRRIAGFISPPPPAPPARHRTPV